jgi:hypothetical protein
MVLGAVLQRSFPHRDLQSNLGDRPARFCPPPRIDEQNLCSRNLAFQHGAAPILDGIYARARRRPIFEARTLSTQPVRKRAHTQLMKQAACGGLRSTPDCRPRRALLHLSYSYAAPCGPALLVTQCHKRTHALQQTAALIDQFVSADEQLIRYVHCECLRGAEIDDQIERGRMHDGHLSTQRRQDPALPSRG